jgi:hypothetical protein
MRDVTAGKLQLFVDCQLQASADLSAASTGVLKDDDGEPDPVLIGGQMQAGSQQVVGLFKGTVDEVHYYPTALTTSDIATKCSPLGLSTTGARSDSGRRSLERVGGSSR